MIVTLTPRTDFSPVPRIEVAIIDSDSWDGGDASGTGDDSLSGGDAATTGDGYTAGNASTVTVTLPSGTATVTLWRTCQGRRMKVRGVVDRAMSGSLTVLDYEAAINVPSGYEVECYDSAGASLGAVYLAQATLPWVGDSETVVIQQPLDPHLNASVRNMVGSWPSVSRETGGEIVYVEGAAYPRLVGTSPRRGMTDIALDLEAATRAVSASVWATLGTETASQIQVWLIRPTNAGLLPAVFFAYVESLVETDITVGIGGEISRFTATVTEVSPPAPGLVIDALSYADLDVSFESYTDMDAAYTAYSARDAAFDLAGAAG